MTAAPRQPSARLLRFYRVVINPVMRFVVRRGGGGRGQDVLRVLRVRGRKSGRLYDVPVRVALVGGRRYVMTMLGDTQWARNLRAAGHAVLISGAAEEAIGVAELAGADKVEFLRQVFQVPQFARRARTTFRSAFGSRPTHLGATEIAMLSEVWFVFLISDPA
jgi:hypothetical protein